MAVLRVEHPGAARHVRLVVEGDLDMTTSPALSTAIRTALGDGATEITVDLGAVAFLDSTGIRALFDGYLDATRLGGSLDVRGAGDWVRRVLEISGVAEVLLAPVTAGARAR
ncbi:STAS domain-containing protein [Longispora sp. NPDC051575]|uniref:STAS domain-containing protein n=1 Tax=Longispora sp. NPDC051575 TaxID=3154943 RepID=UPI00343F99D2